MRDLRQISEEGDVVTTEPKFGPFLESLDSSYRKRADVEAERAALATKFETLIEEEWRNPCPEPSFLRAVLGAVWEILTAIVRREW